MWSAHRLPMSIANHIEQLRIDAGTLPELPGVYFWCDQNDHVLYVGKAVNLRARVRSYFSAAHHDRRIHQMLNRSRSIRHEVTGTELEALFRESALIKQLLP